LLKREYKEERVISAEEKLIRNKITGVLVRTARLRAQKSVDECAAALSCDPAFIVRAEAGQSSLTFPQLEGLARILDVPLSCLLGEQEIPSSPPLPEPLYLQKRMSLRRKIIGVLLRQARLEGGYTLEEMATRSNCQPDDLARIELGRQPIPLPELQGLAASLGISVDAFIDEGDASAPAQPTEPSPDLAHLSPELREFVGQPMNSAYLQIALSLSQMPAEALRQFASGLLEITY
jgi:transcriptional regulator with XRE-family HTH domain